MKIARIIKSYDTEYIKDFMIIEEGCGCCECEYSSDGITIEDLNQFQNLLTTQQAYADIIRRKIKFKNMEL